MTQQDGVLTMDDVFREIEEEAATDEQLREAYDAIDEPSTVLHQFGAWFVTDYGVEAIEAGVLAYHVSAGRLWEHSDESGWSWECQVTSKVWVNAKDACQAFAKARQVHIAHRPTPID